MPTFLEFISIHKVVAQLPGFEEVYATEQIFAIEENESKMKVIMRQLRTVGRMIWQRSFIDQHKGIIKKKAPVRS